MPGQSNHMLRVITFDHFIHDLGPQQISSAVFDFGELRAYPGLKRKPSQQRGAERVDRLNFQPAGGFNRAGKQRACHAQLFGGEGIGHAQFSQGGTQIIILEHRPSAQAFEQPVLHL